jgi:hypothetical protein
VPIGTLVGINKPTTERVQIMKIRIEWPEKKTMDVYPLEEILEIYTPKQIEAGFMGKLDGDAWFCLMGEGGHDLYNWKHELKSYLTTEVNHND